MRTTVFTLLLCLVSLHIAKVTSEPVDKSLDDPSSVPDSENVQISERSTTSDKSEAEDTGEQKKVRRTTVRCKGEDQGLKEKINTYDSTASDGQVRKGVKKKVCGYLDSIRNRVSVVTGNLYMKADPMRNYWGKASKVLSKISLDKLSQGEQLKTMVTALTDEVTEMLPEFTGIDPVEIYTPAVKYICGTDGKIWDLKTLKYVRTKTKRTVDKLTVHITYRFDNLYFTYDTFYIKVVKILELKGKLVINYNKNRVTLIAKIPNISRIIWNTLRKNCIMHITGFKVRSLEYSHCNIETSSVLRKNFSEDQIGKYLAENEEFFKRKFETQLLVGIHRMMASSGTWICKDPSLGKSVRERGGTLEDFVPSQKFKVNCLGEKRRSLYLKGPKPNT